MPGRVASSAVGALAARAVLAWVRADPRAAALHRTNFHGRTVTLAGGPALAAGATLGAVCGAPSAAAGLAAATAGAVAGAVGAYDDVAGARPEQRAAKGFRGHLAALRAGRVTAGAVKVAGIGAAGLAAAALLTADPAARDRARGGALRRAADVALGAGVIAGTANLLNLLDLRPGRAIKAAALLGAPLAAGPGGAAVAGTLGAGAALLPADLGERIMLGDAGANALGALLGVAYTRRTGTAGRAAAFAALAALTAASERVSFTRVIADTPWLRTLDELGRRPPAA